MSNLFEFLAIPVGDRPNGASVQQPAPAGDGGAGRARPPLRERRLPLPRSRRWALRGIDLFIPAGQSLALVGQNGAGKTTFIKLLTRLYDPTEGRILLDGRDLQEWDEDELRRRIGVIFQDFNQYYFLLRENVGVGSIEHLEDQPRIDRAVERGGARELVAELSQGLETQLGRWFAGGRRAVGRAVAEGGAGPGVHAPGGGHPGARRAHRRPRRRGGARRVPALPGAGRGPHHHPDLAPLPHRAHGRSHPGAREGSHHRAGHPRPSWSPPKAATPNCFLCRRRDTCDGCDRRSVRANT